MRFISMILLWGGVFSQSLTFSQTFESATCSNSFIQSVDFLCSENIHKVSEKQTQYWIQFTATYQNIQVETILNGIAPIIESVNLYNGNCGSNQLLETDSTFIIGDSLFFNTPLILGDTYFILFEISSFFASTFESCIINKSLDSGTFYFTDQYGNVQTCNWTDANYNTTTHGDSVLGALYHCNLTFCVTDTICITLSTLSSNTTVFPDNFDFLYAFGTPFATSNFNADFTEMCITFNSTGTTTVYIDAGHTTDTYPYDNVFSYIGGQINQWFWTGDCQAYMNFNVIDQTPPATPNLADIICLGEVYTLNAFNGTLITNLSIDNVNVTNPNSSSWSTVFTTPGVHIVQYTVDGLCQPATYIDTITVINSSLLTVVIDNCNQATFTFTTCEVFNSIQLIYGDGNTEFVSPFTGTTTWTHNYQSITTPVTWIFNGSQLTNPSPPIYGTTFSQTGTVQVVTPQNISIISPTHLCEMNPNSISISSPNNLQNIVWTTQPTSTFMGQGTSTITPSFWATSTTDVLVSVIATDPNGCPFSGSVLIKACCSPNISGTEFFERVYFSNHFQNLNLSSQLPSGYYNGPTGLIAINLPTPQPLSNQITTSYNSPTLLSAFIAANPSVFSGSTLNTPRWVFFNNDLIIDTDLSIVNSNFIRFAPGASMILLPNRTVTMDNSTLAPKCMEMWGGIKLSDITQTVNIINSNIVAAKNGVWTTNGGKYAITGSRFIDNYYGILVENYASAPTSSTITNTYFGDVLGQNLLSPHQSEPQPLSGVVLRNIRNITIGSTSSAIAGNLFHNHQRGISSSRSSVHSARNNFFNIKRAAGVPLINEGDKYAAIYAINSSIFGANHTLKVGGNSVTRNNFLNCEYGISAVRSMNLDARENYMKGCWLRGISAENNPLKIIDIYANQINSTNANAWGIYVKNYTLGVATINYNQINTLNSFQTSITRFAAGIYISSLAPTQTQTTTVFSNTINNCLYGIWMINTTNGVIENNTININFTNAVINSLTANFAPIRGIVVQNSTKAQILGNIVTRNMGTGNGVVNYNLQGIRLELSPASKVWNNRMYNTAVGFYAFGTSLGSRVDCNQMHFTRNGFYLENADLSEQGGSIVNFGPNGYSAHNQWYNSFSTRTDGTMTTGSIRNYYHGSSAVLVSAPNPVLATQWFDIQLTTSNPYTTCVQALNPPFGETPISKRTRELLPIAQNSVQYDTLDYQQKHYLNLAAYSRLESDSNLLIMNVLEDSIYVNYLQENNSLNSQSKIIHDAQKAMAQNDFSNALNSCNLISASCNQYNTNKIVQELWIDRKSNDLEFTSADTMLLMNIACLDPIEFGSGVYQARAIIDWDGFCFNQNKSSNDERTDLDKISLQSKVYPNPTDGIIQIESALPIESALILDLKGSELHNFTINANYQIDTQLNTGVYLLKIILENGIVETHKIYIR